MSSFAEYGVLKNVGFLDEYRSIFFLMTSIGVDEFRSSTVLIFFDVGTAKPLRP